MNFTKLSLAALAVMGIASSASALENVKVDGSVKLWYQTTDMTSFTTDASTGANTGAASKNDGLFSQTGASGDLVAKLRATGDLTKKVGFGTTIYTATTLGLENNLVANETLTLGSTNDAGSTAVTNGDANLPMWLGEAYMTYKAGKTIVKIGRQELDTPLAFSEQWNAAPNTFEAAVVINQDLPDTTLIGAYVSKGNGNGANTVGTRFSAYGNFGGSYAPDTFNGKTGAGAYAAAMVNKSIPNLTLHPVYYDVVDSATAFWIDATYVVPKIVKIEALYASLKAQGNLQNAFNLAGVTDKTTDAYAAKVSGTVVGVTLGASYSAVSKGSIPVANTATSFTKTKLYTASILNDGRVAAQPDVKSWKVEASTKLAGFDLGASYGSYDVGDNTGGTRITTYTLNTNKTPSEFDLSVATKIDDINLAAYYIMQNDYTCSSATLANPESRDRQAVRVIATINF